MTHIFTKPNRQTQEQTKQREVKRKAYENHLKVSRLL